MTTAADEDETRSYPGARRPDRQHRVDSDGLSIAVSEWGGETSPPLLLAHGGFDFAGTMDLFAPRLAAAGWRVVSWDQRGHGDSEHAALYQWDADVRDALAVLDAVGSDPVPFVGHSKGGSLMIQLADALPSRATHVVNLDGVPVRRMPDIQDRDRTKMLAAEISDWLDHRHRSRTGQRKPGTLVELAERRGLMNPRLSSEWLQYLVTIGARRDSDGWRWKIDPALRFGGFGPWRPEWSTARIASLGMPFLAILASEQEAMGWGTTPDDVKPWLPADGDDVLQDDTGHFVHVERPDEVAAMVLDFLGTPGGAR